MINISQVAIQCDSQSLYSHKSIQKQQAVKKSVWLQNVRVKKDTKSKVAPRNDCDNSSVIKNLIMTIQVNLVPNPSET